MLLSTVAASWIIMKSHKDKNHSVVLMEEKNTYLYVRKSAKEI